LPSQTSELLYRLDAAFFGVGEARGAKLAKFYGPQTASFVEELHAKLGGADLDVERLEGEGRLRLVAEDYAQKEDDLEEAIERQEALTRFMAERHLVVQTAILEGDTDEWPPPLGRRAQLAHSATAWLSEAGLATTRVSPVSEG